MRTYLCPLQAVPTFPAAPMRMASTHLAAQVFAFLHPPQTYATCRVAVNLFPALKQRSPWRLTVVGSFAASSLLQVQRQSEPGRTAEACTCTLLKQGLPWGLLGWLQCAPLCCLSALPVVARRLRDAKVLVWASHLGLCLPCCKGARLSSPF